MLSRDANALIITRHGASDKDRDLSRKGATSGGGLPRSTRVRAPESGSVNHDPVSHAPLLPPGSISVVLPSYRRRYFASGSFSRVSPGFPLIHQDGRCRLKNTGVHPRFADAVESRYRASPIVESPFSPAHPRPSFDLLHHGQARLRLDSAISYVVAPTYARLESFLSVTARRCFDKSIIYHGREILLPLSHSIVLSGILSRHRSPADASASDYRVFRSRYNPPFGCFAGAVGEVYFSGSPVQ